MTLMANEWPRIAAEIDADNEVQIPTCWEDVSWHNDMCASFIFTNDGIDADLKGPSIRIWIDYKDAADREMPDEMKRFAVHVWKDEEFESELVHTDSWFDVMANIINYLRMLATSLAWGSELQIKAENEYFLMIEHMLGSDSQDWKKFLDYSAMNATSEELIKLADELYYAAQEGHGNERDTVTSRLVMSEMSGGYFAVEKITGTETELVEAWISEARANELITKG